MANVDIKISPENLIGDWGNMEDWAAGDAVAPTGWTLTGDGSVAKESTIIKHGTYSAKLTSDANGNKLDLAVTSPKGISYWQGKTVTLQGWCYATDASIGKLTINDGVGSTDSSNHTGGSGWEFLTVTHQVVTNATQVLLRANNGGNTKVVYFDSIVAFEGTTGIITLSDYMDVGKLTTSSRYRGQEFRVARRVGVKVPRMQVESKRIRLDGMVVKTTATLSRTAYDALAAALNSTFTKDDGDLEMKELYLFDDRILQCYVRDHKPDYKSALRIIPVKWDFIVPNPFFRAVNKTRTVADISSSPKAFDVTNGGTARTPMVIDVLTTGGAATTIQIDNLSTGQSIAYAATLASGKSLIIDTDAITVENDGTDDLANASNDLEMYLIPGVNKMLVTINANGDTCTIDAWDRWY